MGQGRWLLAGAVLALLTACQGNGAEEQYLERLGRTLDTDVPPVTTGTLPVPPRSGQLQLTLPAGSLDSLDFLAISGCAVQVTIGKRNSSLGRMARPSQRLLLELEYLQLAPECIDYQRAQGRKQLAQTLQQAWELKREQLPALIFNATLGSDEYRAFWRGQRIPDDYPAQTGSGPPAALRAIESQVGRWLADDFEADNLAFELLLSDVASGDGGTLLKALARQGEWLATADEVLAQRAARGPLCSPNIRPAAADILPNVVRKYFIEQLQPRSAALGRRFHALLPPITALEVLLEEQLPPAYRQWQLARDARIDDLVNAPRRHVHKLITLQETCMDPGVSE